MQMREKMYVLFETEDEELHSLLFTHCMYRWVDSGLDLIAKSDNPIAVLSGLLKVDKDGVPTGDVRPIATPSAWSRLINSMLLASIADDLGSWFLTQVCNVRQYGVGVKDGLAQCIHSIRLCLEAGAAQQDPANPYCAIITDISNAFIKLNRIALFQMLLLTPDPQGPWMGNLQQGEQLHVPECLKQWFSVFEVKYGKTTTVRYFKHDGTFVDIECAAGLHQGCPLGSAAFSAVMHVSLAMIMSHHQQVQVSAYIDNVTLNCTVRAANAAFDDLQNTIKDDLTLRLNEKECLIYIPVFSESPAAHARVRAAYDVIRNERLQQGKTVLDLVTDGIILLGSPIGTATFTREYYRKTLPKIHAAIADINPVTDNLLHFRFLQQSVAGKVRGKLRTVPPMLGCDFAAAVDDALANAFLDRACPGWKDDDDVAPEHYVAALQAELAVGGLGMGSLKSTQPAHFWNACTRALQAGGRCGALVDVLPAAGIDLTTLLHLPTVASLHIAHASLLRAGAVEGPPADGPRRTPSLQHIPPFPALHHTRSPFPLPPPHQLTRLLQRSDLEPILSAMPATMKDTMMVNSQQPAIPLAPRNRVSAPTFFQEQQASATHVRPPAPRAWLHHNGTHSTAFSYASRDGPLGHPHGLYMWRALIATQFGIPLPPFQPPWRKEMCPVRACGQELDLHGHHRAACSASVAGRRMRFHDDVVDYLAGQLKRAGFPCTSKEADIPQHPSVRIAGAQHERGDLYIPGFDGSVLGRRTIIDVVRTHTHTKQGEVCATTGARGPRRPTAMAQAVKAKYAKHYGPYLGMGYSFCAFGTGTHGGLEPDACRLLRHLSYARTTLEFQERGLDGAGRDVDEYKRASARNFRHILMNCTLLLTLTGLRQRLPDPLPALPRDQRDLRSV
jgi:hypothetical protein